jgi:serine/threonine-protein kinase
VKVLDFGLAKAGDAESSNEDGSSNSPTLRTLSSTPGMILGTAAYMSPEQAKGRPVDRRTDVFAFGCVLYEMLTGMRAFEGEDVSDTLAAVLRAEPDWTALPDDVSPALQTMIQRCLEKDRAKRIADLSTVKFVLSEPAFTASSAGSVDGPTSVHAQRRSRFRATLLIAAGVLFGAAAVGGFFWALRPSTAPPSVARFSVSLPTGQTFPSARNSSIAISPDGTQLVYVANSRLYRRSITAFEATPIPGSEGERIVNLAFAPDGRSIAFFSVSDNAIKRIPLDGGTPMTIYRGFFGGSTINWSQEGILFGQGSDVLRVSPDGGTPERLVTLNAGEAAHGPQLLPGAHAILFTLTEGRDDRFDWDKAKVVVQSLATGERKTLIDGRDARYLPSGHLVYAVGGNVYATPFDLKQLSVGRAVQVLEGVRRLVGSGAADLSVSNSGTLIYVAGPSALSGGRTLIVTDRKGSTTPLPAPPLPYLHPRVSRDGKHIAVGIDDGRTAYVSISDILATSPMRRLTLPNEGHNRFPVWSGDGQRVAFQSDREGDLAIWTQRADGSCRAVRLSKAVPGVAHVQESWSPDGRSLLLSA